ncbi:MAG: phenylacetate--CoA ligase family protein [Bacilli bacterium]
MVVQTPRNIFAVPYRKTHVMDLLPMVEDLERQGINVESAPRDWLEQYQVRAFVQMLSYVKKHNPFYATKYKHLEISPLFSKQDILLVPLLTKQEISSDPNVLRTASETDISQSHYTSGTSGTSLTVAHTFEDLYVHDNIPTYPELLQKNSGKQMVGIALPYDFSQPAHALHRAFQFEYRHRVIAFSKGGYIGTPEKTARAIIREGVTLLVTSPSYAATLIEEIQRLSEEERENLSVNMIWLTGEGCSQTFIDRLKHLWQADIVNMYGSTECGLVAIQRPNEEVYRVLEGTVLVEIVEPGGTRLLADGEIGEIVVTTLLKEGTPFVRYRTGDLGILSEKNSTDCTMKTLTLRGRIGEFVVVQGVPYSPVMIEHLLLMLPDVGLWYRLVLDGERMTIQVEWQNEETKGDARDQIRNHMYITCGLVCDVEVMKGITRTTSKVKRVFMKGEEL